jgi:hypothetical protein
MFMIGMMDPGLVMVDLSEKRRSTRVIININFRKLSTGLNLFFVFMTPSSQGLESLTIMGRLNPQIQL